MCRDEVMNNSLSWCAHILFPLVYNMHGEKLNFSEIKGGAGMSSHKQQGEQDAYTKKIVTSKCFCARQNGILNFPLAIFLPFRECQHKQLPFIKTLSWVQAHLFTMFSIIYLLQRVFYMLSTSFSHTLSRLVSRIVTCVSAI